MLHDAYFQAYLSSQQSLQHKINRKYWGWLSFALKSQTMLLFSSEGVM